MKVVGAKNIKYVKICLVSAPTEIICNIIYLVSFALYFVYFYKDAKDYNSHQILEFTKSYINIDQFNNIKTATALKEYILFLRKRLYTLDPKTESLPLFIPLSPIHLSQFSNSECDDHPDFFKTCHQNFSCTVNSLVKAYEYKCGKTYRNTGSNKNKQYNTERNDFGFTMLIPKLEGYYSSYDLQKDGVQTDFTFSNYNSNIIEQILIDDKNLKFLTMEINFETPANKNYVDVVLGIEMTSYFQHIKKILSISVYNNIRPSQNILFVTQIFFSIATIINIIKLIYEINIKLIWFVHVFSFVYEIFNLALVILLIMYCVLDGQLEFKVNLSEFESHLEYVTYRKYIRLISAVLMVCYPMRLLSLLSWWKFISEPFVRSINVIFRMFPGIVVSLIILLAYMIMMAFINYFLFNDIFKEYYSLYDSFLNVVNLNIMRKLYDKVGGSKIFSNLVQSQYVLAIVFFEIVLMYILFVILISVLSYLFKKAMIIESPKQESEYMEKLKQIEEKLQESKTYEDTDLDKIKKQVLWLNLGNKNTNVNLFSKYEILLFKNSNQIISFLKYLFALKPELQFKKLTHKLNIIIEIGSERNSVGEKELIQIGKLTEWMIFVGCKIPLAIYGESNFARNLKMKLYNTYKLIFFMNDQEELEKFISEQNTKEFIISGKDNFYFISDK